MTCVLYFLRIELVEFPSSCLIGTLESSLSFYGHRFVSTLSTDDHLQEKPVQALLDNLVTFIVDPIQHIFEFMRFCPLTLKLNDTCMHDGVQILDWLAHRPSNMESYIRPGCTVLTVFLSMPRMAWIEVYVLNFSLSRRWYCSYSSERLIEQRICRLQHCSATFTLALIISQVPFESLTFSLTR